MVGEHLRASLLIPFLSALKFFLWLKLTFGLAKD
jgi:hypothetical protein